MKLLVFAHKPPPHHGQSYMVQLLIDALGGDLRQKRSSNSDHQSLAFSVEKEPPIQCYHVDCRLSKDIHDIARIRWGKVFLVLKFCLEAIWSRFRYGIHNFYYVPAPGMRGPIYRDWIVMALCRPFFRRIIFHWHAVGLGDWLETRAKPTERWLTRHLLGDADLSIVLGPFYRADAAKLSPKRTEVIPNGIPDPCPTFDKDIFPLRLARAKARGSLLSGPVPAKLGSGPALDDATIFRVLCLSLCTRDKGLFDTLEGVALANRQLVDASSPMRIRLTVAGKFWHEREQDEFNQRVAQPDLNGTRSTEANLAIMTFRGFVSGEEKDQLFRQSDCYCFPTYYAHPVSLLEAMAYGLSIITTRWRAVAELFPMSYSGLVEPRAPKQVASALERFMRGETSFCLRQTFLDHFLKTRFVERMILALQSTEAQ